MQQSKYIWFLALKDLKLSAGESKIIWDKDYQDAYRAVEDKSLSEFLLFPADFTPGVLMAYGAQPKSFPKPLASSKGEPLLFVPIYSQSQGWHFSRIFSGAPPITSKGKV